jgi:hypothetical protein
MKTLFCLTAALLLAAPTLAGAEDAPDVPAGGAWTECNILAISAYRNRIGLTCAPSAVAGDSTPRQFAVEMTNPLADATLRLAQQSLTLKRPLRVLYVVAPQGNPVGCDEKTCRGIVGIEAR